MAGCDFSARRSPVDRGAILTLVFKAKEHEAVAIPAALILENNRLDLFPDLQGERLFRVKLRTDALEIQPTGYIGFIPLNNRVAIEVEPRMPIANVEHLLARSGLSPAVTLPYVRSFQAAAVEATPFLSLLAARFAALLVELRYEGVYKTYATRNYANASPSGRIHILPTAIRSRTARRAIAVYERFDRTVDNPANQVILAAGRKLLSGPLFSEGSNIKLARSIKTGLELLDGVTVVREPEVPKLEGLPEQRPHLNQLVSLSGVILREHGVQLRGEGLLRLPTFLIKMEDVFEAYSRSVFQAAEILTEYVVEDGNKHPPAGAARQLFTEPGALGNRDATPDIVVSQNGLPECVIEVKYKPCKTHPERDNLNQLLTYANAYDVKKAVLLYPAMDTQSTAIEVLGNVNGIATYKATLNLAAEELAVEEGSLCAALQGLLAP